MNIVKKHVMHYQIVKDLITINIHVN